MPANMRWPITSDWVFVAGCLQLVHFPAAYANKPATPMITAPIAMSRRIRLARDNSGRARGRVESPNASCLLRYSFRVSGV
jgi:hypothetical protein